MIPAFRNILRRLEAVLRRADTELEERRQAEQALRDSEERLSLALAAARTGIWDWQVTIGRLIATPQAEAIFGLRTGAFGGTYEDFLRLVHPEDVDRVVDFNIGILDGRLLGRSLEHRIVRPDGSTAWVESRGVLHRDPAGKPLRVVGTVADISERKSAEARIRGLNVELEQRVRERTLELETANKELESFSYSVSHDLRGSLRRVEGFTRILTLNHAGRLDEQGAAVLARVRGLTQHMGRLIDDLLRLAHVNRQELVRGAVDLSGMAREVAASLAATEPEHAVEFAAADRLTAMADPGLMRVVLENLLGNAWKFTRYTAPARVEFGAARIDGETVYRVRDNGAGFDMTHAAKLFGAFQRLHLKDEFEGNGIGLATVRRIVNRHGGRIWAESAPHTGATFYFTLESPATR